MTKEERSQIAEYIRKHPELTYIRIAKDKMLASSTIARIAAEFDIHRQPGTKVNYGAEEESR